MNTHPFRWMPLLGVFVCFAADAQQDVSTEPLETLPEGAVDISARLGGQTAMPDLPTLPEDGYWIDNAPINEVFQYLARSAGLQFFFNNELAGPEYTVTGHLKLDNPRQQMEDLAMAHGLTVYQQQSMICLMTETQLVRLPVEIMSYQLKYLRGAALNRSSVGSSGSEGESGGDSAGVPDFEKLKAIIRPMLTRTVGQIEFEEKTNTLLVTDNSIKLERVRKLLTEIDKAKQQIMVNVRVLRVKRSQGRHVGIDWHKALGEEGTSITATQNLNALFNLPNFQQVTLTGSPSNPTTIINQTITPGAGVVFGNTQVTAILRALEDANLVSQEACPTIITEDNEQGVISIVDRFPIITSDITNSGAGVQNITDKVRYKIDEQDPSSTDEPEKSREIGVTLSVTPTILPDGTVRMKLRPRVAKIVELIPGRTGNVYPRVSESTVEAISRIPKGQSLFLGGFYDYSNTDGNNKVPVLGSLPFINKLFSSESRKLEQVSLVFIITPRVYDASNPDELPPINWDVKEFSGMHSHELAGSPLLLPGADWQDSSSAKAALVPPMPAAKESWMKRMFTRSPSPADVVAPEYSRPSDPAFLRR